MLLRVAVDLARRCEQEARALELGEPERIVRALRADFQRVQRHAQIVDRARERREVEDEVDRLLDLEVLGHVVVHEDEFAGPDVLDVAQRARDQVVDADHPVAPLEQVVAEMRAEEPGSSGDDRRWHAPNRTDRAGNPFSTRTGFIPHPVREPT